MAQVIDIEHRNAPVGEIHGLVNWVVPDEPSLNNLSVSSDDLYKAALVSTPDGFVLYILTSASPVEWWSASTPQDLSSHSVTSDPSNLTKELGKWTDLIVQNVEGLIKRLISVPNVVQAENLTGLTTSQFVMVANDGDSPAGSTFYRVDAGSVAAHNPPSVIKMADGQRLLPLDIHYPIKGYVENAINTAIGDLIIDDDPLPQYQLKNLTIQEFGTDIDVVEETLYNPVVCTAGINIQILDDATLLLENGANLEIFAEVGDSAIVAETGNVTILEKDNDLTIPAGTWRALTKIRANTWALI